MQSRNLRSALWYAGKMNWYIVPLYSPIFDENKTLTGCTCEKWIRENRNPEHKCATPGKHPRYRDWEENATNDLDKIKKLWDRDPLMNVGIAAGKSGLLCFDVDSYKDSYAGVPILNTEDYETVTSLTGSGGSHILFKINPDDTFTNARKELPTGIDIRCHGGQFVAPPSIHPSGRLYQWESGYAPHEMAIKALPDSLRAVLSQSVDVGINPTNIAFDADCTLPDMSHIAVREDVLKLIHEVPPKKIHGVDSFRSQNDWKVIVNLVYAGATDSEIKALFDYYPIGKDGKYAEQGSHALNYLRVSIAEARGWVKEKREEVVEVRTETFFKEALKAYRF